MNLYGVYSAIFTQKYYSTIPNGACIILVPIYNNISFKLNSNFLNFQLKILCVNFTQYL